uniref:Large ribosomal subunit protein mL64 n=1 Tax=Sphenodon punctatus TaxID=8508 RepID=A0A8D0H8H9_SPHPU
MAGRSLGLARLLGSVRGYRARPLQRFGGGRARLPEPLSEPGLEAYPGYDRKQFGRRGAASGVDPARLWPDPEKLREMEAEEREWHPALRDMEAALEKREREEQEKRRERENRIAAQMAKMPQMIANWRRAKEELKAKEQEEKARRERLLAEMRERFNHSVDPRSPEFQEMVNEMEKTRRKELKLQKKRRREEEVAKKVAKAAASPKTALPGEAAAGTESERGG